MRFLKRRYAQAQAITCNQMLEFAAALPYHQWRLLEHVNRTQDVNKMKRDEVVGCMMRCSAQSSAAEPRRGRVDKHMHLKQTKRMRPSHLVSALSDLSHAQRQAVYEFVRTRSRTLNLDKFTGVHYVLLFQTLALTVE